MMKIFTVRTQAFIEHSIDEFGSPEQKTLWREWATADDSEDSPMTLAIVDVIVDTLHRRFDHLTIQLRSPITSHNEAVKLSNDMGILYAIARSLTSESPWTITAKQSLTF
jgi:hypothetical protein